MRKKLNKIIHYMDRYFKKNVFMKKPPLNQKDIYLIEIAMKIIKLKDKVNGMSRFELNCDVNQIMTYMEVLFKIPLLELEMENWLNEDIVRHQFVWYVYSELSKLCSCKRFKSLNWYF